MNGGKGRRSGRLALVSVRRGAELDLAAGMAVVEVETDVDGDGGAAGEDEKENKSGRL